MDLKKISSDFKSLSLKNYMVLGIGLLVLFFLAFLFFRFVADRDKLSSFEENLNLAVEKMYSSNVGSVRAVVIPLPGSIDSVCLTNYKAGNDFGVDVALQPEKIDGFKLDGVFAVERNPFCIQTSGSFNVKMQLLPDDVNFVGVYLSSKDASLFPSSTPDVNTSNPQIPPDNPPVNPPGNPPVEPPLNPAADNLSEIQQSACQSASAHSTCSRLADIGLVTIEQCCSSMSLCC